MTSTAPYVGEMLRTSAALLALWALWFVLFRDYRVDALRQRWFELRGELFAYAASGAISFEDPAYWMLRARINAMIRYGHHFSAYQFFGLVLFGPRFSEDDQPYHRWEEQLAKIDKPDVKKKLREFNARMFEALAWHLITGSVVFMALFAGFAAWAVVIGAGRTVFEAFARKVTMLRSLEAQAAEIEHLTLGAT